MTNEQFTKLLQEKQANEEKFFSLFGQSDFVPSNAELEFGQNVIERRLNDVADSYCEYFDEVTDLNTCKDCIAECLEIVKRMRDLYFDAKDRRENFVNSETGRQLASSACSWLHILEKQIEEEQNVKIDVNQNIFVSSDFDYVMHRIYEISDQVQEQVDDSILLTTCQELMKINSILELNKDENLHRGFKQYFLL